MNKRFNYFPLLAFLSAVLFIQNCEDTPLSPEQKETRRINSWIQENMEMYYFWNDNVPQRIPNNEQPEDYFGGMLVEDDIFSYIRDDAATFLEELDGNAFTAGYSPVFGRISDTEEIFIIVRYVYPDSPADLAGLERGDIILEINNQTLTTSNYIDLYNTASTSTLRLGQAVLNEETGRYSLSATDEEITVAKDNLSLDPLIYSDVLQVDGARVGYIFYGRFLIGDNNAFRINLNNVLQDFASQDVDELIVDLRYNPGGRVDAAANLANAIVPQSVASANEVMVEYQYNEEYTAAIVDYYGTDNDLLYTRFSNPVVNLGLDRVYFLTSDASASASELLINGLRPYMDVVQIGTNTFGKFFGSYVFSGLDELPMNNYAIVPVVTKYANALGVTDFVNGLEPDYEVQENLLEMNPIGDVNDPLLSAAIQHISSGNVLVKRKDTFPYYLELLPNPREIKLGNTFGKLEFKR